LAHVACNHHFAEHDFNQDLLVVSLVQNMSPTLSDEALDGYLSELSSSGSESEGEPNEGSGIPKYKLEDLSYAKALLPYCLIAPADSFFLELEKGNEKGSKGQLKPLSILKPKTLPTLLKKIIPAPPIIAPFIVVTWTLLTLTARPNASLARLRLTMGYQILAGKA
jgi:hypothetical protein